MLVARRYRWIFPAILSLSLVVSACGGGAEEAEAAPADDSATTSESVATTEKATTTTEATTTTVAVEETEEEILANLSSDLEQLVGDWQETNGAPAVSVSVRLPGQEPINFAGGVTDLVTEEPVATDDYFRIASITKSMTAAVVLQLAGEGLLELDEPVQTYLPAWLDGYEYADQITIRQLMDHTNGLKEYAFDPEFYTLASERLETPIEPEEIIDWLADQQPLFAPGEQYSYETGGFLSLGRVIEQVTGNSAAEEMRSRIFEPAGAENIYLTPNEFPPEDTVNGYGRELMYFAATGLIGREDPDGLTINGEPVAAINSLPQELLRSSGWTGGGNEAQVESVSAVFAAMFNGTILSDEQIEEMTTPALQGSYGLGIDNSEISGVRVYSHGGGVPGFRSQAGYLPEHDVAYALSSTLIPLPAGSDVGDLQTELVLLLAQAAEALAEASR